MSLAKTTIESTLAAARRSPNSPASNFSPMRGMCSELWKSRWILRQNLGCAADGCRAAGGRHEDSSVHIAPQRDYCTSNARLDGV
jgi:hypothetical protein